jgi:hypothetical protein
MYSQIAKGAGSVTVKGQHKPLTFKVIERHGISGYILNAEILRWLAGLDFHLAYSWG